MGRKLVSPRNVKSIRTKPVARKQKTINAEIKLNFSKILGQKFTETVKTIVKTITKSPQKL